MKIQKLFQRTRFGIFLLFGVIVLSTSILCIYTVDTQLTTEYETNSRNIAKSIADSSVDILLNRNLATLQSMIDQFVEVQGIRYIYITSETGEYLAHTFVPGIPEEILASDHANTERVERSIPGLGDFMEVGSPILAGVAGTVHVGMDLDVVALKIQRAIGQQVILICVFLVVGILASIWLVNLAAKPLAELLAYAVAIAGNRETETSPDDLLGRDDEVGDLARLFQHISHQAPGAERTGAGSSGAPPENVR